MEGHLLLLAKVGSLASRLIPKHMGKESRYETIKWVHVAQS